MKKLFFCALAAAVLAAAGCSKNDEMSGNAKVGGSDYTIIAADAYWWWDVDNWSNTELILWTSYVDYFYIDLYWDGEKPQDFSKAFAEEDIVEGVEFTVDQEDEKHGR